MSTPSGPGPFIGAMTRLVWQWVRRQIHDDVVAAGFHDLNPSHTALFRYPGLDGRSPTELADEMQITKQSVNDLLGHLERGGYIRREQDPVDSRRRRIRLTARGRGVEAAVWSAAEGAERRVAEAIGDRRLEGLRRTLADVIAAVGAAGDGGDDARRGRTPREAGTTGVH